MIFIDFFFFKYHFQYSLYNQKELWSFPNLQGFWWTDFSAVQYVETFSELEWFYSCLAQLLTEHDQNTSTSQQK